MYNAKKLMTLQRNLTPRSKQPPTLPYELQKASIDDLPVAAQQLLQSTPVYDREYLLERLVLAIKSTDEDVKSRAWISLVSLGSIAILPIGVQLLQKSRDRCYRLRLVRLLGELGENHALVMGPLMQLLRTTRVPEVLGEAQMALMRINNARKPGDDALQLDRG